MANSVKGSIFLVTGSDKHHVPGASCLVAFGLAEEGRWSLPPPAGAGPPEAKESLTPPCWSWSLMESLTPPLRTATSREDLRTSAAGHRGLGDPGLPQPPRRDRLVWLELSHLLQDIVAWVTQGGRSHRGGIVWFGWNASLKDTGRTQNPGYGSLFISFPRFGSQHCLQIMVDSAQDLFDCWLLVILNDRPTHDQWSFPGSCYACVPQHVYRLPWCRWPPRARLLVQVRIVLIVRAGFA